MTKQELRTVYKEKRLALTESERARLDDLLLIQLQRFSFPFLNVVMDFMPFEKYKEPNVLPLSQYLNFIYPHLRIAQPKVDASGKQMQAFLIDDDTEYEYNALGILEPHSHQEVNPEDIDLIFIPLLAFDENGFRVGYGKGMYDQFLQKCRPDVVKIGVSYFGPVPKIEDADTFDVALDYCITPEEVFEF